MYKTKEPDYSINPYHQVSHHPLRFTFLKTKMSIKEQEKLKSELQTKTGYQIRVKREQGYSLFMCASSAVKYMKKHIWDNYNHYYNDYKHELFEMEL